jgi:F0F1-type ATP synthase membrane subunit b/b'
MEQLIREFGLDFSLFVAFFLFFVFHFVMKKLIFSPFLKVYEARLSQTVLLENEAVSLKKKAFQIQEHCRETLSAYTAQKKASFDEQIEALKQLYEEKIHEAQAEAKKQLVLTLDLVEQQRQQLTQSLHQQIAQTSDVVVEKLSEKRLG